MDLLKVYEDKFYELEKQLASVFGQKLPDKLNVNFQEPQYPMSVDDQIKLEEHEMAHNLNTDWKILQKHNQDLTDAAAKKIIESNKEENGKDKEEGESEKGPQGAFSRLRKEATEPK